MAKRVVDIEGMNSKESQALKSRQPPDDIPFTIQKIGHVVLMVTDIDKSVEFYTQVMGFKITDVYPDSMMNGRMVFMRFNPDHHGIALIGSAENASENMEMHHMAFEVDTLDEVFRARDHLQRHGIEIQFEGRRRAGAQVAVEFADPDGHCLEIYWGLDQVDWEGQARPPEGWAAEPSLEEAIDNPPVGQNTNLANPKLRRRTS